MPNMLLMDKIIDRKMYFVHKSLIFLIKMICDVIIKFYFGWLLYQFAYHQQ